MIDGPFTEAKELIEGFRNAFNFPCEQFTRDVPLGALRKTGTIAASIPCGLYRAPVTKSPPPLLSVVARLAANAMPLSNSAHHHKPG